jgi:hypothetical protein
LNPVVAGSGVPATQEQPRAERAASAADGAIDDRFGAAGFGHRAMKQAFPDQRARRPRR